jgi:hypothetical protein
VQRRFIVFMMLAALFVFAAPAQAQGRFDISPWVMRVMLDAEVSWQRSLGPIRGGLKLLNDEVAYTDPLRAWRNDNSLSRYNIRPSTAYKAIRWAQAAGAAPDFPHPPKPEEVIGWIMSEQTDTRLVELILNQLRDDHPQLRDKTWQQIEANDEWIAKLYSGYAGAGNAWDAWRADLKPGAIAIDRLGCQRLENLRLACALAQRNRDATK